MILEIAQINIKSGSESAYEAGFANAVPIIRGAKGCLGVELRRSVEIAGQYWLLVQWEALENHTVDFAQSSGAATLASSLGLYVDNAVVVHSTCVIAG